jgi:hypothetical protein
MYDTVLNRWATAYHRGHILEVEGPEAGPLYVVLHLMETPHFPLIRGTVPHTSYRDAVAAGTQALDELLDRH